MKTITTRFFHKLLFLLQTYDDIIAAGYLEHTQPMTAAGIALHSSYCDVHFFNCIFSHKSLKIYTLMYCVCRSQWLCGLRPRSTAASLLRSWVRIPPGAWMFVCCVLCVLSGRGLCDEMITRPDESYRLWRVVVRDQGNSLTRKP
jgi:hypothetical protein